MQCDASQGPLHAARIKIERGRPWPQIARATPLDNALSVKLQPVCMCFDGYIGRERSLPQLDLSTGKMSLIRAAGNIGTMDSLINFAAFFFERFCRPVLA